MDISVITELESRDTHWTRLYIIGIRAEAKRVGINLFEVFTDGSSMPEEGFKCKTAIVLGQSSEWICGICTALLKHDIKPVVVGSAGKRRFGAAGCVLMDYETAVTQLLDYFNACGRKRVALFSVSATSPHDTHKTEAFLHYRGGCYTHNDIFYYIVCAYNGIISAVVCNKGFAGGKSQSSVIEYVVMCITAAPVMQKGFCFCILYTSEAETV